MKKPFYSILGVTIHRITTTHIMKIIKNHLGKPGLLVLFPINIHILVELMRNPLFLKKHRAASIIFPDGVPLTWAPLVNNQARLERVSGTGLTEMVLKKYTKIFLIAPTQDILHKIVIKYNKHERRVVGGYCPPHAARWGNKVNQEIIRSINKTRAQIVLVGVGPLKQEMWIINHARKTRAHIFIAVGSALDILSGNKPRSPRVLQNLGLEWLWRIKLEPKRLLGRYMKDVVFLLLLCIKTLWKKLTRLTS